MVEEKYDMKDTVSWHQMKAKFGFIRGYCVDKTVLSIGCGLGHECGVFATVAKKVVGVDIDEKMIEYAKAHYPEIDFIVMDATVLKFPDEMFDVAVGLDVVEHIGDIHLFLSHVHRVLKKDGMTIWFVPIEKKLWHTEKPRVHGIYGHRWGFTYEFFMVQLQQYFDYVYPLSPMRGRAFKELDEEPLGATAFICFKDKSKRVNPWNLPENPKEPFRTTAMYYPEDDRYKTVQLKVRKWEKDKVLDDPAFQAFIDGLFECKHVKRITLLGSLIKPGYEPFEGKYDNPEDVDIDVGLEYDDSMRGSPHPATEEIKECLEKFGYIGDCVYVPSELAPDSPFGKVYRIHIEHKPHGPHIILKEKT